MGLRSEAYEIAESMISAFKRFQLSLSTLFLALSILERFSQKSQGHIGLRDVKKVLSYMALSLAAKYTDRIAFKYSEFIKPLGVETELEP